MGYCERVREFSCACHADLPEKPLAMSKEDVIFAVKMVNDEMDELKRAEDVVDQADAIVDAIYYLCDVAVRAGVNIDPIFEIVHRANMTKVIDGKVRRREDGKILKPEGFVPPEPQIKEEIGRQHYCGSF